MRRVMCGIHDNEVKGHFEGQLRSNVLCLVILVKVSLNDCHLKSTASIQTKLDNSDQWVGDYGLGEGS